MEEEEIQIQSNAAEWNKPETYKTSSRTNVSLEVKTKYKYHVGLLLQGMRFTIIKNYIL